MDSQTAVTWPAGYEPDGAAIYAVNVGHSTAAPDAVWAWLTRPDLWNSYYDNAKQVKHLGGPWPQLALGSRFKWTTFNTRVTSEVAEHLPHERLAWRAESLGARGYHAWVLTAKPDGGTEIRTEETQRGALVSLLARVVKPQMIAKHQQWVDNLANLAATGKRP